jgi:hypothetical protein
MQGKGGFLFTLTKVDGSFHVNFFDEHSVPVGEYQHT